MTTHARNNVTTHERSYVRAGGLVATDAGALAGRLVPWATPAEVSDDGHRFYQESWAPGSLRAEGVVPVYAGHAPGPRGPTRGPLVGRLEDLEDRPDGLYGTAVLADTPAAAELRALARTVGATFSIEFATDGPRPTPGAAVVRTAATLIGVAVLVAPDRGAYPGADVLSVRTGGTAMDSDDDDLEVDDTEDTEVEGEGEGAVDPPAPAPAETPPSTGARAAIVREVRRELARGRRPAAAHPLARYGSAYEFHAAARTSRSDELPGLFARAYREHRQRVEHGRAWVDQLTTENPGVMPPGWLSEVFGIIDMGRPVIGAIGTRPLPASGMDINWPYFDGDLHALVGQQLAEKTDITSVKVSFKKATENIATYAGGSDISWQLIRRSDPSYRDAYLRIMQAAYSVVTDNVAGDGVTAGATGTVDYDPATPDPDGTLLRAAVFEASSMVQIATGSPASYVLSSTDVFLAFAGMPLMVPSSYGTQNVTGTATASTLDVNVSGLSVILAPDLAPGTALVSNRLATSWLEDGPFVVTAPDIPKLGEDVAIWGMGALAVFIPAGVVKLAPAGLPLTSSGSSGSSKSSKSSS